MPFTHIFVWLQFCNLIKQNTGLMCTSVAQEKTLGLQKRVQSKSGKDHIMLLLLFNAFCRHQHFSTQSQLSASEHNHAEIRTDKQRPWIPVYLRMLSLCLPVITYRSLCIFVITSYLGFVGFSLLVSVVRMQGVVMKTMSVTFKILGFRF